VVTSYIDGGDFQTQVILDTDYNVKNEWYSFTVGRVLTLTYGKTIVYAEQNHLHIPSMSQWLMPGTQSRRTFIIRDDEVIDAKGLVMYSISSVSVIEQTHETKTRIEA
jgi:hypothetical protein